jgi:hypothetical protein
MYAGDRQSWIEQCSVSRRIVDRGYHGTQGLQD